MRGDGGVYQRGNRWWISYYDAKHRRHQEPGGRTAAQARAKLRTRRAEIHGETFIDPRLDRQTVDDLLDAFEQHLTVKGSRSIGSLRSHAKPIREEFGHLRAADVNGRLVERYQAAARAAGKANATINRGVEALRAAFRLAQKQDRLRHVPYFPMLREENARQGFFEADDFRAVAARLSPAVADAAWFAYWSGWRRGEIVGLRWEFIDRAAREARIPTSKNGRPRSLPLDGPLWDLIERRWSSREFTTGAGATGLADLVFHRGGKPLGDFDPEWQRACVAAGLGEFVETDKRGAKLPKGKRRYVGRLFHDLRRTAYRDMIRAGVPERVVMEITGHRTRSMGDRYNITSEDDKRAGLVARFARMPERSKGAGNGSGGV